MDFYQKNPTTLRRLLTKRQNPYTQIFKPQPLNSTNEPMTAMNFPRNDAFTTQEEKPSDFATQNSTETNLPPKNIAQSPSENYPSIHSSPKRSSPIEEEEDHDSPIVDNVQKKIKTSMITTPQMKFNRNLSCEEEKSESGQSTSCETGPEFYTTNETGDFMTFPQMLHQPSRTLAEFNLSSDEDVRKVQDTLPNVQQAEENTDTVKINIHATQKVKCKLNHQCDMEVTVNSKKRCPRCEDLLRECKEFAKKNDGSCLNEEYEETIRYRCNKGHCWNLNHKNARRRWCAQCSKEQRAFLKQKCEEEKVHREKQEEENQKKLFEEAKKQAIKDQAKQSLGGSGGSAGCGNQKPMNTLEYFQRIDYEIESLAKKYTLEFMSQKSFTGEMTYQQILQIYKILIMPEEILQSYMFNLSTDTLRSEFRRIAKIIHPDKNKHPQAGNAFQKIHKVYEVALSRLEGNQQKI